MIGNRRVAVVLPAYNAAKTLYLTCKEIPRDIVDDVILTDDASRDDTVEIARALGLHTIRHDRNRGYGGNQKTCYAAALERGADIVVMLHPDYQYSPKLVTGHGGHDRLGPLRCGAGVPDPRARRARGRHAALQICGQSRL